MLRATILVLLLVNTLGCNAEPSASSRSATVRWLSVAETAPQGSAPNAKHRVVSTAPDGTREIVLVVNSGDDVMAALADLAKAEKLVNARINAIGAVSSAEVAWFHMDKDQYKAMKLDEQLEVVSLIGDVALGEDEQPIVHAHAVLGREDGTTLGGHVIGAIAKPSVEVYVTAFPNAIYKKKQAGSEVKIIDLAPR